MLLISLLTYTFSAPTFYKLIVIHLNTIKSSFKQLYNESWNFSLSNYSQPCLYFLFNNYKYPPNDPFLKIRNARSISKRRAASTLRVEIGFFYAQHWNIIFLRNVDLYIQEYPASYPRWQQSSVQLSWNTVNRSLLYQLSRRGTASLWEAVSGSWVIWAIIEPGIRSCLRWSLFWAASRSLQEVTSRAFLNFYCITTLIFGLRLLHKTVYEWFKRTIKPNSLSLLIYIYIYIYIYLFIYLYIHTNTHRGSDLSSWINLCAHPKWFRRKARCFWRR